MRYYKLPMDHFLLRQSNSGGTPTKKEKPKEDSDASHYLPWVEKYRPKKVGDLVFQNEIVAILSSCVRSNGADLPNMLFYGPPGTGKTSAAIALCRQLFKDRETFKDRVLEMNASDERGIDIVRTRIKDFSRIAVSHTTKTIPLKIVILDEADAMTNAAQSALRRTMESESQNTRFILICNYISRIIDPLTSRCSKFRFKPLPPNVQEERIKYICAKEKVDISNAAMDELLAISNGDLRKSITILQSLSPLIKITIDHVNEASGYIPHTTIMLMFEAAKSQKKEKLIHNVHAFTRKGYSVYQFVQQLADVLLTQEISDPLKLAEIFEKMAECELRLLDGADEMLQLYDLLAKIMNCFFDT